MIATRALRQPAFVVPGLAVAAVIVATLTLLLARRTATTGTQAVPDPRNFYRTDAWTALGGDWSATGEELRNATEERGAKLVTHLGPWTDFQVQADVQLAEPFGEAGLIIRSSGEEEGVDAYHGYFAGIRSMDDSVELGRAGFGWRPLVRARLPEQATPLGRVHLRVVAVGCTLGVTVEMPDGKTAGAITDDANCLRSGHFGLRSDLTSATWSHLQVGPAGQSELLDVHQIAAASQPLPPALLAIEPADPAMFGRYTEALRTEAKKHEVQPGVAPIIKFLFAPGVHPDVTLQGVVISPPPLVALQDDSNALIVPNVDMHSPIKLGDVVVAHGTVISDRFRSRLEDAQLRVLWSDMPIPPLAVTAAQLTSGTYRGRSIDVEGTLRSVHIDPNGYELILQDGQQSFRAVGARDFQVRLSDLQPGSRLRLRGIATSLPSFTKGLYPFCVVAYRVQVVSAPPWWSPKHILWLTAGIVALLLLIQIALHRLQRWHLRSLLHEREQLAFEMHDTLAQSFTGIAYQLQAASIERRGTEMIQAHIRNALDMVKHSHREASRTIAALRPQYRDAAGILSTLKEAAERLSDGGDLEISTRLIGRTSELPLEVTDSLFRIGQEAVSNAVQHGHCKHLTLTLHIALNQAQLIIADDGLGFTESEIQAGLGLAGMRARATKIKARFDLDTAPGKGTVITTTAPIQLTRGWLHRVRAKLRAATLQGVFR